MNDTPAIDPSDAAANHHEAVRLHRLGQIDAAVPYYKAVLALMPHEPDSLHNLGLIAQSRGDLADAMRLWSFCIAHNPGRANTHNAMGGLLTRVGRLDQALAAHEKALAIAPDNIDGLISRGNLLVRLRRNDEALVAYDRIIEIRPDLPAPHANRAGLLADLKRSREAIESCRNVLRLEPTSAVAESLKYREQLKICDWSDHAATMAAFEQRIVSFSDHPIAVLSRCDDPMAQKLCSETYVRKRFPAPVQPLWTGEIYRHDKIRIAYVSSDFRDHPVAHLISGLFEQHDRDRFDITAYALSPSIGDVHRLRIEAAFPEFHDVSGASDLEVAQRIRAAETDILIDLNGLTRHLRPAIFAARPAPIQISYLGYPGTIGHGLVDYILADAVVVPHGREEAFCEHVIRLPHSYQVNDDSKVMAEETLSRREAGLPETGFVFTSFNAHNKITPPVFDIWMRLLLAVPGSVLWLIGGLEDAVLNLRAEAEVRGVSSDRLVFASRVDLPHHLARHRLADLFLDTLPYTAHTTASDALWAGLPLVTCIGEGFAARVAASLLTAVELPELITESLEAYEALALALARDPERLKALRARLIAQVPTTPLFNTHLSRRHIEAAYIAAWELYQRGEPPKAFDVGP